MYGKRRLFGLVVSIAAMVAAAAAAKAGTLEDVKKAGVLRVAVMQDYAPFGSIGPDMAPVGLDIDLAKSIATKLGVKVSLVPVTGANRFPYLQTGKVDLIIACLGKTAEREKVVGFSAPYALTFNGVYGAADKKVEKPADLAGLTIGASRGGTEDLQVTEVAPPAAVIKRFQDSAGTLSAYASGQVDMLAMGSSTAFEFNKSASRKLDMKFHLVDEPTFVGTIKSDTVMLNEVNGILSGMKQDGTLSELSSKWLGSPLPKDF